MGPSCRAGVPARLLALTPSSQTHCPVYLVNVSSMSAGDVIAAAKMQGMGSLGGQLAALGARGDMGTGRRLMWALGRSCN